MSSRMANPAMIIPEALEPIQQLYAAAGHPPRRAPDRELCSSYTRNCCRTLSLVTSTDSKLPLWPGATVQPVSCPPSQRRDQRTKE